MNTNEQITALLHGELTNDRSIAELMHILSVSPEKRTVFLEHIRLSRRLLRAGDGLAPSPAASQGVWTKIAALEPGSGAAISSPVPLTVTASPERKSDWKKWGLFLLLLLAFGSGGYLLGSRNASAEFTVAAADTRQPSGTLPAPAFPSGGTEANTKQSVPENGASSIHSIKGKEEKIAEAGIAGTAGRYDRALQARIAELNALLTSERKRNILLVAEIERMRSASRETKEQEEPQALLTRSAQGLQSGTVRPLPPATPEDAQGMNGRAPSVTTIPADILPLPSSSLSSSASGAWRIEMRQHLRSSLPGVNGLDGTGGILSDREIGGSRRFTAMERSMRLGVAVGGTTFAQIYHTNTGGAPNDTIIEQAPHLTYGRAYIAPSIFEGEKFAGVLELGGGATELGPIGTAGLNLEYRAADRLTFQAGVSSWLLWTSFRNQLHTSTNLNAHIGVSLNP